jgi:hypothetical protein
MFITLLYNTLIFFIIKVLTAVLLKVQVSWDLTTLFLELFNPEDEITTLFRNVSESLPVKMVQHPRGLESANMTVSVWLIIMLMYGLGKSLLSRDDGKIFCRWLRQIPDEFLSEEPVFVVGNKISLERDWCKGTEVS